MNLLNNWRQHCYSGPCEFSREGDNFTIQTDAPYGRGSWYCFLDSTVVPGQQFQFSGQHLGGAMVALFYSDSEFIKNTPIVDGQIITIPEDINRLRVDLRLWNQQGIAHFQNISLEDYEEPDPEQPVNTDPLPVPLPNEMQCHAVTGYKWGSNMFLLVEDGDAVPGYFQEPNVVRGHQVGRDIHLKVGFPFFADLGPSEEEE